MSGSTLGGKKAATTNKSRYGLDFYGQIGRKGGKISRGGGFASMKVGPDGLTGRQRSSIAGQKGGIISKRGAYDVGPILDSIHENPEYFKNTSPVARIRNLFNR